jgi:hypothetical protein
MNTLSHGWTFMTNPGWPLLCFISRNLRRNEVQPSQSSGESSRRRPQTESAEAATAGQDAVAATAAAEAEEAAGGEKDTGEDNRKLP